MAYSIQQKPGSLILSFIHEPDGNVMVDLVRSLDKAISILDDLPRPVHLIVDFRQASMDVDDLLKVASTLALGPNPVAHHANVVATLFVSTDPSVRLATAGLASPAFGAVKLAQFETLEEALAYTQDPLGALNPVSGVRQV
jgi:hypothetical protein